MKQKINQKFLFISLLTMTIFSASNIHAANMKSTADHYATSNDCINYMLSFSYTVPIEYGRFFRTAGSGLGIWEEYCDNSNCVLSTSQTGLCTVIESYGGQALPVSNNFFPYFKQLLVPIMEQEVANYNNGKNPLPFDGKLAGIEISCPYKKGNTVSPENCSVKFTQ